MYSSLGDHGMRFYGSPYMYLYAILIGILFLFNFIMGYVSSVSDFIVNFLSDPSAVVLAGRFLTVSASIFTSVVVYAIARNFLKQFPALIATLAFASSENVIFWSHFAKMDMFNVFVFNLTLFLMFIFKDSKRLKLIAMFSFGIAIACKLASVSLGLPILVALCLDLYEEKKSWKKVIRSRLIWISPFIVILGLFIADPWAVINLPGAFHQIFEVKLAEPSFT